MISPENNNPSIGRRGETAGFVHADEAAYTKISGDDAPVSQMHLQVQEAAAEPVSATDAQRLYDDLVVADNQNAARTAEQLVADAEQERTFLPATWLYDTLQAHGLERFQSWILDIHKDCENLEIDVGARIFLVNQALRLNISELTGCDTAQLRGLITDKLDVTRWTKTIVHGLLPRLQSLQPATGVTRD